MSRSARRGFSLAELLVVLAIVAILIGLFTPAVRRVREPARRTQCINNLKQLVVALHSFEDTGGVKVNLGSGGERLFPPGCIASGTTPEESFSWIVALLPYLEQDALYRQFSFNKGYAMNETSAQTSIATFLCPSWNDRSAANTHYVALAGIGQDPATRPAGAAGNGFMGYDRFTSLAMIRDGASNTIALMETRANPGPWARGGPSTVRSFDVAGVSLRGDNPSFGGLHPNGISAMVDGSVRSLAPSVNVNKLAAAITIADGDAFDLD